MRLLLAILLASITLSTTNLSAQQRVGYFVRGPVEEYQVPDVSIVQLIANPQIYNGKRIRIVGYLRLEFEGDAIYLHREDLEQQISKNAIWIDRPKELTPAQAYSLSDGYVICTGVFHGDRLGHMNLFSGEISDVNRIEPWPTFAPKTNPASSNNK